MKKLLLLLIFAPCLALAQNTGTWTTDYTEDATPAASSVFTFQWDDGGGLDQYWANWDDMIASVLASPVVTGTMAVDTITDSTGAAGVSIESVTLLAGDITTSGDLTVTDLNADELVFAEGASVTDPGAGFSKFWVKSDTPTTAQFTDDANTTFQLATLTGTETLTNKTISMASNTVTAFPVSIGVAMSDETTDLTVGDDKVTIRAPYAFTLTEVRANVNTAPTGSGITVDVEEGGTTVFSTLLTIDATEETSETAATAAVISDTSIADDAELTFNIDVIGSTTAGKGLKIWLIGTRSL